MIHHDTITAKRARVNERGDVGAFDIIEDDRGEFAVYEGGYSHASDCGTLEEAMKVALHAADDFDRRALEVLKTNWSNDPTWDIEDTEGYEDVRQELYVYRLETELGHARNEIMRLHSAIRPFGVLLDTLRPVIVTA